jgi:hypothetical protein
MVGVFDVVYKLIIPPYKPIKLKWQKRCGEEPITKKFVSVGTAPGISDLIWSGE